MRGVVRSALQSLGQRGSVVQFEPRGGFMCSFTYYDANHAVLDA
jgi:hypothetical protein